MTYTTRTAIIKAIQSGSSFFAMREPDEEHFKFGAQVNHDVQTEEQFIIAPFNCNAMPTVRIANEMSAQEFVDAQVDKRHCPILPHVPHVSKEEYLLQVQRIVDDIKADTIEKAILSFPITHHREVSASTWCDTLELLSKKYPHACVFIFHTPETGFWLGATPELLGKYDGKRFSTMALAGTRPTGCGIEWTTKETSEQGIVAQFIATSLKAFSDNVTVSSQYTRNAGPVEHLCNDISCCASHCQAIDIVEALHPTPAIGGSPQRKAVDYVTKVEKHNRLYYGGYFGLSSSANFTFYVNLRSLIFSTSSYTLYVGGGITADSIPENEWCEICNKSRTLNSVIDNLQ